MRLEGGDERFQIKPHYRGLHETEAMRGYWRSNFIRDWNFGHHTEGKESSKWRQMFWLWTGWHAWPSLQTSSQDRRQWNLEHWWTDVVSASLPALQQALHFRLLAVPPESSHGSNKWGTHEDMSEEARGGGRDSFKAAWWEDLSLIALSSYFCEHSSQVNKFLLLHGAQHASDLMMLSDTGPAFLSDKICTLENQVHSSFCPRRAPVGPGCHLSPSWNMQKMIPTRTASLRHYSEWQCKIKDAEGCWKTNSWVKMEKFCQEIRFLCLFPVLC